MSVYQFKTELVGYRPKMWRRFQVESDITVAELGFIVMTLYQMDGDHLMQIHYYQRGVTRSGRPSKRADRIGRFILDEDRWDERDESAHEFTLEQIPLGRHAFLVVHYDFGDDWMVKVTLEKVLEPTGVDVELPHVLGGHGHGIIEDWGGPYALMDLAEELEKKEGPAYERYREWMGLDDYDDEDEDEDEQDVGGAGSAGAEDDEDEEVLLDLNYFNVGYMNVKVKTTPQFLEKLYEHRGKYRF